MIRPFFEDEAYRDLVLARIMFGRIGQVADLPGATLLLRSGVSAMMTGQG